MPTLIAKISFDDNRLGQVKRGEKIALGDSAAKSYVKAGLLEYVPGSKQNPLQPAGTPLSASPAGQASPQTTATPLKRGRKRKTVLALS